MKYQQRPTLIILTTVLSTLFFVGCSKSGSNPPPKNTTPSLAITSLSVNTGPYNTSVVITGTEFSSTIANDQVFFNGKPAVLTAATSTQLTATVPLGAGTGAVSVAVNNGTTVNGPTFTYQLSEVVSTFAGGGSGVGYTDGVGLNASFGGIIAMTIDASGTLFVVNGSVIRKITPKAVVTTYAGSGADGRSDGPSKVATFNNPAGLGVDGKGNVYVADGTNNNLIRKIGADSSVTTIAGGSPGFVNGNGTSALFRDPGGIVVDASGNLFITDTENGAIRKMTPSGDVTTFAGNGTQKSVDGAGTAASFYFPWGITIDASGNLYVVDNGSNKIRKVTNTGVVTTIAGSGVKGFANGKGNAAAFNLPNGICIDPSGNLYVCDTGNNQIRKITPDGTVSTFAGGVNPTYVGYQNGSFGMPDGIAIDASGNIYVSDSVFNVIRKISMQ
jgi:hypothetical protein